MRQVRELAAQGAQERENHERGDTKPTVHQQVGEIGSTHTCPVLNRSSIGDQVTDWNILDFTLIRRSREEEGDQRKTDINRQEREDQPRDKPRTFIREKGLEATYPP